MSPTIRRRECAGEDVFYYLTVMNENYPQPAMPQGAEPGILRGMYRIRGAGDGAVRLLGSGSMLREWLAAAELLEREHRVRAGSGRERLRQRGGQPGPSMGGREDGLARHRRFRPQ